MAKEPKDIWLYRITHYKNIPHILDHGLLSPNHPIKNPDFVPIGDKTLITVRNEIAVNIPPGGTLHDYVPFYLGAHSPMLYQIKTGYDGVKKIPQSEIVYLLCNMQQLLDHGLAYVFTDGHARNRLSSFYNSEADLDKIDWEMVGQKHWNNHPDDHDRQRRKQAEFLAFSMVPVSCIHAILVLDEERNIFATNELESRGLAIPVHQGSKWYY